MDLRILADMPISPRTVKLLGELGFEVTHVLDRGLATAADEEIVEFAQKNGYTILTEDLDFGAILAEMGIFQPGVMILRVGNWPTTRINERLKEVLRESILEKLPNSIVIIERTRVRVRPLPIGG